MSLLFSISVTQYIFTPFFAHYTQDLTFLLESKTDFEIK